MAIMWDQVENGVEIQNKILAYSQPKFLHIEYKTVEETNQRTFSLNAKPSTDYVKVYINHLCYYEDTHFTVTRSDLGSSVYWFYTLANNGFDLDTNDRLYVEYWSYSKT